MWLVQVKEGHMCVMLVCMKLKSSSNYEIITPSAQKIDFDYMSKHSMTKHRKVYLSKI